MRSLLGGRGCLFGHARGLRLRMGGACGRLGCGCLGCGRSIGLYRAHGSLHGCAVRRRWTSGCLTLHRCSVGRMGRSLRRISGSAVRRRRALRGSTVWRHGPRRHLPLRGGAVWRHGTRGHLPLHGSAVGRRGTLSGRGVSGLHISALLRSSCRRPFLFELRKCGGVAHDADDAADHPAKTQKEVHQHRFKKVTSEPNAREHEQDKR